MPIPDHFIKPAPGLQLPRDPSFPERMRTSLADASDVAKALLEESRQYRDVEIVTADGQRMTVRAKFIRPAPAAEKETWWTTVWKDDSSVTIRRGMLKSYMWEFSTPGEAKVIPNYQTAFSAVPGATGVEEDIPVTGLEVGDYLWVEVRLVHLLRTFATQEMGTPPHIHAIWEVQQEAQGGDDIPYIKTGDLYAPVTTPGIDRLPFAQFKDGRVLQLHEGLLTVPPFATVIDYQII